MGIRTLGHVVAALVLAGCACTQIGCNNQITFALPFEVQPDVGYAVLACIDERCSDAVLTIDGGDLQRAAISGDLSLSADTDRLELHLGDGDLQGSHHVTLSFRDDAGASVATFEDEVELAPSQPNGSFCGPVCWSAQVDL